eukprot:16445824-Heterocapsa_arctica.AAC.1
MSRSGKTTGESGNLLTRIENHQRHESRQSWAVLGNLLDIGHDCMYFSQQATRNASSLGKRAPANVAVCLC